MNGRFAVGGHKGRGVSIAETFGSEVAAVASAAVDLLVGSVAGQHGVEGPVAIVAVEAFLVPHLRKRKHFRMWEHVVQK